MSLTGSIILITASQSVDLNTTITVSLWAINLQKEEKDSNPFRPSLVVILRGVLEVSVRSAGK
jgi:hypothetical protein